MGLSAAASADVQLTIQNGRVSLVAKDATLRQILAEWETRQCRRKSRRQKRNQPRPVL